MDADNTVNDDPPAPAETPPAPKKLRGFAAMAPERLRELASRGGKIVQASGKGHQFTVDEARAAGKKGGSIVSQDREHMRAIGSKGGWICAQDPAHMSAIGKKGAATTHAKRKAAPPVDAPKS